MLPESSRYALVLDTETSGLPHQPAAFPISLGVVVVDLADGSEMEAWHEFMRPPVVVVPEWERAEKIHGISREHIQRNGKHPLDVLHRLDDTRMRFGGALMYAFNVSFDAEMLLRAGWTDARAWGPCLMESIALSMGRHSKRVSLKHALEHHGFGGRTGAEHSALEDAYLAAGLAFHLGHLK